MAILPLDPDGNHEKRAGDGHDLPSHLLTVVHLWLSSPVKELDNVLGHLRGGGGGLVVVLDETVVENTSHGNAGTGEVRVEVETRLNNGASWGLLRVTGKKREDVVAATVSGLDNEGKIRRQSTVVGGTSGLIVLVRAGKVVGELSGALLNLALIVGLSVVLVLFGEDLGLIDSHEATDNTSVGDTLERVARGADFTVDLETSAEGLVIVGLVGLFVLPWVLCWVKSVEVANQRLDLDMISCLFKAETHPSSAGVMACAGRTNW